MARITIAKLQADLEGLRHNNELSANTIASQRAELDALTAKIVVLNSTIDRLTADNEELRVLLDDANSLALRNEVLRTENETLRNKQRPLSRPIYEWDPTVPGDFHRAAQLAHANGGVAVRARAR